MSVFTTVANNAMSLTTKFSNLFGIGNARTKNIIRHVGLSFLYKGGSVFLGFAIVPLTIDVLTPERYGIWLTISSFIAWFSFFDIGLGNGLRNKFTEAKSENNFSKLKIYTSVAYISVATISLSLFIIFILFNGFIQWNLIFNVGQALQSDLLVIMPIVFGFFCIQLTLKLILTILVADQYHSAQAQFNFFSQAISLAIIWLMSRFFSSTLLSFASIISIIPVIILFGYSFFAFSSRYRTIFPSFKNWQWSGIKEIMGLGIRFFVIQIAGILLFSTGNIIISQLLGPEKVVPYNLSYQYFGIANMAFSIILAPYWSSVTDAYIKGDSIWIKSSMNKLTYFSFIFLLLLLLMVFVAPTFFKFWVGDKVVVEFSTNLWMALFFAFTIFYSPYTYFINGTGKVKLQMISLLFTAVFNIPLSFLLVSKFNMGISGVIASTVISLIPHVILSPMQYHKIIQGHAKGIWNA